MHRLLCVWVCRSIMSARRLLSSARSLWPMCRVWRPSRIGWCRHSLPALMPKRTCGHLFAPSRGCSQRGLSLRRQLVSPASSPVGSSSSVRLWCAASRCQSRCLSLWSCRIHRCYFGNAVSKKRAIFVVSCIVLYQIRHVSDIPLTFWEGLLFDVGKSWKMFQREIPKPNRFTFFCKCLYSNRSVL